MNRRFFLSIPALTTVGSVLGVSKSVAKTPTDLNTITNVGTYVVPEVKPYYVEYTTMLNTLHEKGIPIPTRVWAAAGELKI